MSAGGGSSLQRYRIDRYLTEGGMGAIYLGRRLGAGGFEKRVVLKQLLPEFINRPEFRDLFFREAKITAGLDHVNIVRTYDLVRSDDFLFIVMEYVPGSDLRTIAWRARLRRRPVSVSAIMHVGMEVLAGLEYAHTRKGADGRPLGIVHRDVSPSNILCSGHGDVKLSDFGIAKQTTFASTFYRVRGKVGYMSPEQARNLPLDGRSDLYSLAVCLFEALSGERLFIGDLQTPPDAIYGKPLPGLMDRRPEVPQALDEVLRRALSQEPAERYPTAHAFSQALRQVARDHGLLYSASQLAAELTSVLGPDPERWSQEDATPLSAGDTERMVAPPAAAAAVPPGAPVAAAVARDSSTPIVSSPIQLQLPPRVGERPRPSAGLDRPIPTGTLEAVPLSSRSSSNLPAASIRDASPPVLPRRAGSAQKETAARRRPRALWILLFLAMAAGVGYLILESTGARTGGLPGASSVATP